MLSSKESKLLQQQRITSIAQIQDTLRILKDNEALEEDVKKQICAFLNTLSSKNDEQPSPVNIVNHALVLFRQALSNKVLASSSESDETQSHLHQKIAQALNDLLLPYLKKHPKDKSILELRERLNAGLNPTELLECCLILIRCVVKDIVLEVGSAGQLISDIHKSLQKVNTGIKTTIEHTKSRMKKELKKMLK